MMVWKHENISPTGIGLNLWTFRSKFGKATSTFKDCECLHLKTVKLTWNGIWPVHFSNIYFKKSEHDAWNAVFDADKAHKTQAGW